VFENPDIFPNFAPLFTFRYLHFKDQIPEDKRQTGEMAELVEGARLESV
jgi:hypothetical protein